MNRLTAFSSPYLLGFEQIEQMLDRVARSSGDAFPPYNVERVAGNGGAERLRISLAVAGFDSDELTVEVEASTLTIRGRQTDSAERDYLYRGIAARQFVRSFVLAEGMEVSAARLENGLLQIDLLREVPKLVVRQIPISVGG